MPTKPFQNAPVTPMAPAEAEKPFIFASKRRPGPGRRRNVRQQRVLKLLGLFSWVVLLCSLHCSRASGQVAFPSARFAPLPAIFGTMTDVKPNLMGYEDQAVWGFTLGGYLQTSHVLGFEARGSITRWGGHEHQEAILFGPRAAIHVGRFSPYISALGGAANSWSWREPGNRKLWVDEKVAPDFCVLGGLDIYLTHHLSLRAGEGSYSRIYRSDRILNAPGVSAGFVYRFTR